MVRSYMGSLRKCQRHKTTPGIPAGLLQPINLTAISFQPIRMDTLDHFHQYAARYWQMIAATDGLTQSAETEMFPYRTVIELAKFFTGCILFRRGAPEVVITDKKTVFTSRVVQEVMLLSRTYSRNRRHSIGEQMS